MRDAVARVDLASLAAGEERSGALWRLDGEDLQANLVRLGAGDRTQPHRNDEVDVLLVVVSGRGELTLGGQLHPLAPMSLVHLPKGRSGRSRRSTGRLPTCRSTAADRRACRSAGTASGGEAALRRARTREPRRPKTRDFRSMPQGSYSSSGLA